MAPLLQHRNSKKGGVGDRYFYDRRAAGGFGPAVVAVAFAVITVLCQDMRLCMQLLFLARELCARTYIPDRGSVRFIVRVLIDCMVSHPSVR